MTCTRMGPVDIGSRVVTQSCLATESPRDAERAVVIQEKLRGQEHGLDVAGDLRGTYVVTVLKRKPAMRAGETDSTVTVDECRLRELGWQIAVGVDHIVNLDLGVLLTDNGPHVLQMNPRFGGGYPCSHLEDANQPAAIVAWPRGERADASCFRIAHNVTGIKGILPVKVVRLPEDYTSDAASSSGGRSSEEYKARG